MLLLKKDDLTAINQLQYLATYVAQQLNVGMLSVLVMEKVRGVEASPMSYWLLPRSCTLLLLFDGRVPPLVAHDKTVLNAPIATSFKLSILNWLLFAIFECM